ncbi:MAG: PRTRC system protein D [Magnetococcales bacterium]|nr:PRTRC system protein D [Magnetococcales bacterium]NGZ25406.1 PRTRC system protein D [Magnetococcales bacterium]
MSKKIIAAFDGGYGNCKFTGGRDETSGAIITDSIPSIVTTPSSLDKGERLLASMDVVKVRVDGVEFEVGKDTIHSVHVGDGRSLNQDYANSPYYMALFHGTLHYMKHQEVDLLVAGLPVNAYWRDKAMLAKRLEGSHIFPNGKIVVIQRCVVIPQPMGGFMDHMAATSNFSRTANVLVLDPGYFTMDFLVCHGLKPIKERSGSFPGGMSNILAKLSEEVSKKLNVPITSTNTLEQSAKNGWMFEAFGKPYDLKQHLPAVAPLTDLIAQQVVSKIGNVIDISRVILVGGGADFFLPAFKKVFPNHTIEIATNPAFANVRGFFLFGERHSKNTLTSDG